jgi:GTP-binding protein
VRKQAPAQSAVAALQYVFIMDSPQPDPNAVPVIAIVGRPNVGKSALFNRLLRRRLAIVHEQSGVTRDRVTASARIGDRHVLLVDTGGLGFYPDEKKGLGLFDGLIREQVEAVLGAAARILLVTDAMAGRVPLDEEIAAYLRRRGVPVIVVPNKADNPTLEAAAVEAFVPLGFEQVRPVSCLHGLGIGELERAVAQGLPERAPPAAEARLRIAVVGRPNVGKSSLVNRLLGERRMIVSDVPGTTRDAVDLPFTLRTAGGDVPALLVDTAGLRHRPKVDSSVEFFSVLRAEKALERADLVLLVLEAHAPPTSQDRRIARLICEAGKPCLLVANKWDLLPDQVGATRLAEGIHQALPYMNYAPVVAASATEARGLRHLHESIGSVYEKMHTTVPTSLLNRYLHDQVERTPPAAVGGRHLKVFYTTLISTVPPRLVLFVNHRDLASRAYVQFLQSRVRETFFADCAMPVTVELRDRPQKEGRVRPPPRRDAARRRPRSRS